MRENRTYGLEGGGPQLNAVSLPLSLADAQRRFTFDLPVAEGLQTVRRSHLPWATYGTLFAKQVFLDE
jgi:hypothetical protein